MGSSLLQLLQTSPYMPHGHCYLWEPPLVWTMVLANLTIGLSYVFISCSLLGLVYTIRDLPFKKVYLAFGLFIVTCGITHFSDIYVVWHPLYWVDAGLRVVTAIASLGTALLLPSLMPRAFALVKGVRAAHARGIELETAVGDLERIVRRSRELETLKARFFTHVNHELRTPLTLILAPLERLMHEPLTAAQRLHSLQVIERNARLLMQLVTNLLDVSRADAHALQVAYARLDLAALLHSCAANFSELARARNICLRVEVSQAPMWVELDPDKVARIVLNLIDNAFKFTPVGGHIDCSATFDPKAPQTVVLRVADSGCGVPDDERHHIFDRFAQLEKPEGTHAKGAGLGLCIVRDFARAHQGSAQVLASSYGGALFEVRLACRAPSDTAAPSPPVFAATKFAAQRRVTEDLGHMQQERQSSAEPLPRLLLVEDNPDMRELVCSAFTQAYQVVVASDGEKALQLARAQPPQIIVSDQMMPRMSGSALLAAVRSDPQLQDIPFMMLTARTSEAERVAYLTDGANDFLGKPFSLSELRARVANLLSMAQARHILQVELHSRERSLDGLAQQLQVQAQALRAALDEARAAQAQAEKLSRVKTDFINMISHELRTPLTAVLLQLARLSRQKAPLTDGQKELIAQMRHALQRLGSLIESLLHHNRSERGVLQAHRRTFLIDTILDEVMREMAPQADNAHVQLLRHPSTGAAQQIVSDPDLMRMITGNLVGNAIKFTPQAGTVSIRAEVSAQWLTLTVSDNGPGISEADQKNVFIPFVHLEPVSNKHTPGVGLGLALVANMTRLLGGTVDLHSQLGEGTTFVITLPVTSPACA